MKTALILTASLLTGTLVAQTEKLSNGLEFHAPAGWQVTRTENGAVLTPPNAVAGSEAYVVALLHGVANLQDPQLLSTLTARYSASGVRATSAGAPVRFQTIRGAGFEHSYDVDENGQSTRLQFYLVPLAEAEVAAVVAAGPRDVVPTRAAAILAIAASLQSAPRSADSGTLAQHWRQKLSGARLMQFNSYSSGSSGGYNSQKTLVLAAGGSYVFRASSATSIYAPGATGSSAGHNGSEGAWRVYEQNGQAMLELQSAQAGREVIVLTTDGSKTFLNGRRWLVAPL